MTYKQCNTSVVPFLTETVEPATDLSEALLDLDLREDLLELFLGEVITCDSVSGSG